MKLSTEGQIRKLPTKNKTIKLFKANSQQNIYSRKNSLSNNHLQASSQMQSHNIRQPENDSDTDEGFIPSKNIINEKKEIQIKKDSTQQQNPKKEFLPRYILEGIMRKEPTECHQRFLHFDSIESEDRKDVELEKDSLRFEEDRTYNAKIPLEKAQKPTSKQKEKLMTPYDKYIDSGDYILTYSRYRDFKFSNQEPNFAGNYVRLDCIKNGSDAKIKAIKPFEVTDDKNQQVLTQNMQKSNSIRQSVLKFDSRFECGNLLCAFKHKKEAYTYTLFIHNDTNTYGYNHWFYFSVKNSQIGIKYRFHIVNFRKRHSFFREGNRPTVFSLIDSRKEGMSGYSKKGQNVKYGKSPIVKSYDSKERFFQLSFSLEFSNQNDICYISAGLPYSYSKLLKNLSIYEQIAKSNKIKWTLESVGTSIGGNDIPYVTITKIQDETETINFLKSSKSYCESPQTSKNEQKETQPVKPRIRHNFSEIEGKAKRVIFLTARQHPGETWSSYLMDEFMYSLVAQTTPQAKYILQNFIVKLVPMINVDGVISGNFRCDLTGMDLNRNWKTPSTLLHPHIFSMKTEIQTLVQNGYQIEAFFDLHGHSKEYNLFCYSCKTDNFQCRLLPYILSQYNEEFHFPFCTFGVSRYKLSTARAVVFGMTKNPNVLTIESSFFGSKIDGKINIFQPQNFSKMAASLIKACKSYFSHDENYFNCRQIIKEKIAQFMQYKGENQNPAFSGSDSQPSGDEMEITQKLEKILPKTLIQSCPQIAEIKKAAKKAKKKLKKMVENKADEILPSNEISFSFIQNQTVELTKQATQTKSTITNWQTIRVRNSREDEKSKTINLKNQSFMMSSKSIDDVDPANSSKGFIRQIIERQEHKLPFFSRQRHGMIPMKLKNESLEIFKDAYNATEKQIKHRYDMSLDDVHNQKRYTAKKLTVYKDSNDKNKSIEDLPILCVLSQNKKKRQMEASPMVNEQSKRHNSNQSKLKTAIQARTEAIKNLRERNKNSPSMDLVSKIWRQNIQRYGKAFSAFRIDND